MCISSQVEADGLPGYPEQYYFGITNHGLNKIAEEEGLGASLIRPRREVPHTPNKPIISPTKFQTGHLDSSNPSITLSHLAREGSEGDQTEAGRGGIVDVDMDDLTKGMSKLESSLSFVPTQVRRKGKGKAKAVGAEPAGIAVESMSSYNTVKQPTGIPP